MIKQFISLEWRQFRRSSAFGKSLVMDIIIGFLVLYFAASFLFLGIGIYFLLEDAFPGKDPLELVNQYLVYWFLLDLVYRFFIQKLPVMNIKPLMVFPIKKRTVLYYLLGKSSISLFNILPLFFYIPFSIVLLTQGYPAINVIPWFFALIFFELSVNYLNFLINKINAVFYGILILLVLLASLQYFGIYNIAENAGLVFERMYEVPYAFTIPLLLLIMLFRKNYAFLERNFYLDESISEKQDKIKVYEFSWLDRFGDVAVFLKNDINMIMRNKRPKQVLFSSAFFLFYGLFFFTQETYEGRYGVVVFASIFITGGFLLTFGQSVPSWDSEYYKLLMSQNIPYRKYLESKWYLMVLGTFASFILSIPYLYFGVKTFAVIAAGAVFNIGLNSFITLWGGTLNRIPIELNVKAKAFSNSQNFSLTQFLIFLPKVALPAILFLVPYYLIGFKAGLLSLVLSGIIGLLCRNYFLKVIEGYYQKGKYKTISAYAEKN